MTRGRAQYNSLSDLMSELTPDTRVGSLKPEHGPRVGRDNVSVAANRVRGIVGQRLGIGECEQARAFTDDPECHAVHYKRRIRSKKALK
jgi:hypothetical protein